MQRQIRKIGVIGAGQIGPDIALHFSKCVHRNDVPVVLNDIVPQAVESARNRIKKKLDRGVIDRAFKPDEAESILTNIIFSTNKSDLKGADLVIEAATENLKIKQSIFSEIEGLCAPDAILASNSSHMEPELIFEKLSNPSRSLVIHYFFPAERNILVEIVPGKMTDPSIADFCMKFYESIGKLPVLVKSRYGYAVDPIFEGLFQAAALCVEEGLATAKQVDAIACRALGLGVGPFTAMNLTGGNPITQHGLNEMNTKLMRWFKSPKIMDEQITSGNPWEAEGRDEKVDYDDKTFTEVSRRLTGAYFGLTCNILQSGIIDTGHLDMALETGLVIKPPFQMMNKLGVNTSLELVRSYARLYPDFEVPQVLVNQAQKGTPWQIPYIFRDDKDGVAVLTIKRPRYLNALNQEVLKQIRETFEAIGKDPKIQAVVITAFGKKVFVSGADINMLSKIQSPEEGTTVSREFNRTLLTIENLNKPVVCAMNGAAFGGWSELAIACHTRIARKNIPTLFVQPEVKLGIIPGAGGTQRMPRLIGLEKAWGVLRAAEPISSESAKELGLVHELFDEDADLIDAAIKIAKDLASGRLKLKSIQKEPLSIPEKLPEVNIGTLSKKIDSIIQKAILEGARVSLEQGLDIEAKYFGECCKTRDMRIGMENFMKTNLKEPAKFVHE